MSTGQRWCVIRSRHARKCVEVYKILGVLKLNIVTITQLLVVIAVTSSSIDSYLVSNSQNEQITCKELFRNNRLQKQFPCICSTHLDNSSAVDCDRVAFFGHFPLLPFRSSITVYTQRFAGIQNLESQLFTASEIRLKRVDFSHNLLRRLMERLFDGLESSLLDLNLAHNLLGDQLNPIFATNEFQALRALRALDLSYNDIRALDSNIFYGLKNLTHLNLEGNALTAIPSSSVSHLKTLQVLNLGSNYIDEVWSFPPSLTNLKSLNLSNNQLTTLNSETFASLSSLRTLNLKYNKLRDLSALRGLHRLETLDLSNNFFESVPIESLANMTSLKKLLLASNCIEAIDENAFNTIVLPSLELLDLNRNQLKSLSGSHSFFGLSNIKHLSLAYNAIRKLETNDNQLFVPLIKLEVLDLTDNQLTYFPTVAFHPLKNLRKLFIDYNKLTSITEESLSTVEHLEELSLAYNLLQEIPDHLFSSMRNLRLLNLHGNKLEYISQSLFTGIDQNLLGLDVGYNELIEMPILSFPRLLILNAAMNKIEKINGKELLESMPSLRHFNISYNEIINLLPEMFANNNVLEVLDLQANQIERVDRGVFFNSSFTAIDLSKNRIKELSTGAFEHLWGLKKLDLSKNEITSIKNGAFERLSSLKMINLRSNKLTSFKGDFFNAKTNIEIIDLCNNQISYLYPNSFTIHRKLHSVHLCHNKLSYFPSEILNSIRTLENIDLSFNKLQSLDNADFANIPRLRELSVKGNEISFINSNVFHNSTLLQHLDLSDNRIQSLPEVVFKGIARLNLDLSYNSIRTLPDDIFNRQYVFTLEAIDLSANNLTAFPSNSLRKQYSCLERINLANNRIDQLPHNSDVLVNIKDLDLSNNPLTPESQNILFGEPKSVRNLNVASTKLQTLPTIIEAPFLKSLNVSQNNITRIEANSFQKSTLVETLDFSSNKIHNLNVNINGLWEKVRRLKKLYLSRNPIQYVMKKDFEELNNVEVLDLSSLPALTHFECDALSSLRKLKVLKLFGYRSLNYLEVQECLSHVNSKLEMLGIEVKEHYLQGHLQRAFSNRINEVLITGDKLTTISPNSLMGVKSSEFKLKLMNTSVTTIPAAIFSSMPMSTKVELDLQSNDITNLNDQLLNVLDSKQMNVKVLGLENNPIKCDCNLEPLWKWSQDKIKSTVNIKHYNTIENFSNLTCNYPSHLYGYKLINLELHELICGNVSPRIITVSTSKPTSTTRRIPSFNHHKPDIIFEAPSTRKPHNRIAGLSRSSDRRTSLTKVDTMIIGIVAGVIAFVCILILIICVAKLRAGTSRESASTLYGNQHPIGCTCLKPMQNSCTNSCYPALPSPTAFSSSATIPYFNNTVRPMPIKVIPTISKRRH